MSRSGYTDDGYDDEASQWAYIRHRGAVRSSLMGKRGQAFLKELAAALDAMPEKWLTKGELEQDGEYCALGVVGAARGLPLEKIDTEDWAQLSEQFGISETLAREIMSENDDGVVEHDWKEIEICGPMSPEVHYGYHTPWWNHTFSIRFQKPNLGEIRWRNVRAWVEKNIKKEK